MKRVFALILALGLLVLCGCRGTTPVPEEKAPLDTPAPATEAPASAEEMSAEDTLTPILAEIRERMHPGTAGSSLTAEQLAVLLLDWSLQTGMDEAQIRAAAEAFLAPLREPERGEFAVQATAVEGAAARLLEDGSEALMEDIGGTAGTLWPWTDAPTEKLDVVFSAVGTADAPDPNQ